MKAEEKGLHESMTVKTYTILLVLIMAFGLLIRIIGLDRVPPGISSDVLLYFANAHAIADTGRDIYGRLLPLYSSHKGFLVSPVTVYVIAGVYKLFGFSHVIGYLPNIVMSTLTIVLTALLGTHVTSKRRIGVVAALLLAVSPWHYHLSRTGFEGVFGFSLVLAGVYCSLLAIKKPSFFILSFILFTVATFSYKAINVFLLLYPVVFLATGAWKQVKLKHSILFTGAIWTVIVFQWLLLFAFYHDSYSTGFITNNIHRASVDVQTERLQSDAPRLFRVAFSNVPVSLSRILLANYAHFFSPQYLLTMGDNNPRYSTGGQGQIYLLDVLLIVGGIAWLVKTGRKSALLFLAAIIIVAPVASLISDEEYAVRTFISVFALVILGACGIEYLLTWNTGRKLRSWTVGLLCILYAFSFLLYIYRYHFLYVHYGREAWGGANKEVFTEAYKRMPQYKRITFGRTSEFDYLEFMYWNNLPVRSIQKALSGYDDKMLSYGNVHFVRLCSFQGDLLLPGSLDQNELLYTADTCFKDIEPLKRYDLPKTILWYWKTYDATSLLPRK